MADKREHTIGVIGTGSFGRFVAAKMKPHAKVRLVGRNSSLQAYEKAAKCDFVLLAIPFNGYEDTLVRLKPLLMPTSVIVDVCSVKILPIKLIKKLLPGQPLLATHPLFGPQSAARSLVDQTIIICPQSGSSEVEKRANTFFEKLGLKSVVMSATKHDQMMADLQGLTFFVARALNLYGIDKRPIMTPSYYRLLELARLEEHHSPELFATIQLANPYASESSKRFKEIIDKLTESLRTE